MFYLHRFPLNFICLLLHVCCRRRKEGWPRLQDFLAFFFQLCCWSFRHLPFLVLMSNRIFTSKSRGTCLCQFLHWSTLACLSKRSNANRLRQGSKGWRWPWGGHGFRALLGLVLLFLPSQKWARNGPNGHLLKTLCWDLPWGSDVKCSSAAFSAWGSDGAKHSTS